VLAVVFSLLLTVYLIVPEAIFRTIFGYFIPPRNFVLTRTETAYRAVLVTILPFSLALTASWYAPIVRNWPFPLRENTITVRRSDYKTVVGAMYSDKKFDDTQSQFWPALTRCIRRQGRLALWYFFLVGLEAGLLGWAAANYSRLRNIRAYKWFADRVLFKFISEWHPLLTPYLNFLPGTVVQADVLCTNDVLYQGVVSEYFLQDGKLTGIILHKPRRFERQLYLEAKKDAQKASTAAPDRKQYWVTIPSENLYFFPDKIVNMNLTYLSPPGATADLQVLQDLLKEVLSRSTLDLDRLTVSIPRGPRKK